MKDRGERKDIQERGRKKPKISESDSLKRESDVLNKNIVILDKKEVS